MDLTINRWTLFQAWRGKQDVTTECVFCDGFLLVETPFSWHAFLPLGRLLRKCNFQ